MFESARLKLTAWYLAIIMSISMCFSLVIYAGINQEFGRIERFHERMRARQERFLILPGTTTQPPFERFDPNMITNARIRIIAILGFINVAIFGISGAAGYFLAGRTLKPIREMVDEQNRFVTDASHELRTPLTSLRSEIEVGLRNKSLDLKDSKKILESNLEEVINLQYLSDNLLELSQTGKPTNSSTFVIVSLLSCIDGTIKKLDPILRKKEITIEKKVDDIKVPGIQDRICEVITILLDNAVKYSPKKSTITISAKEKKDSVEISIQDNGIGIDENDLPYIFDRFYRASKSRSKEKYPGYGLGLSIAKKIVETHHGSISVISKLNKGATFIVTLPLKYS